MLQAAVRWNPAGPAGNLKHAGEVAGLAGIGYVDHPAGAIAGGWRREAIANGRQIGGGVVKAPIALLHDHRRQLVGAALLQKYALGAAIAHQ